MDRVQGYRRQCWSSRHGQPHLIEPLSHPINKGLAGTEQGHPVCLDAGLFQLGINLTLLHFKLLTVELLSVTLIELVLLLTLPQIHL